MSGVEFTPTHSVPADGLPYWDDPDATRPPDGRADPGLELMVLDEELGWARVRFSNGWETWVDGRQLLPLSPPAEPGASPAPLAAPAAAVAEPAVPSAATTVTATEAAPGPARGRRRLALWGVLAVIAAAGIVAFVATRDDDTSSRTKQADSSDVASSSRTSSSSTAARELSEDMRFLQSLYGKPTYFAVTFEDGADGPSTPIRQETWSYPEQGAAFVFLEGDYQFSRDIDVAGGTVATAVTPEQITPDATLDDLAALFGHKGDAIIELDPAVLGGGTMYSFGDGVTAFFVDGHLRSVEILPSEG